MPPRAAAGLGAGGPPPPPGGLRAAFTLPSGCDEALMLATVEAEVMSEEERWADGDARAAAAAVGLEGLPKGEVMVASGEVGGEGDSSGDCCSSGEAILVVSCRPEPLSDAILISPPLWVGMAGGGGEEGAGGWDCAGSECVAVPKTCCREWKVGCRGLAGALGLRSASSAGGAGGQLLHHDGST